MNARTSADAARSAPAGRLGLSPGQRGAMNIIVGTSGGQIIGFLCAPLLARLYGPSDFGVFTVVSALAVTVGTVAALRLEQAVPLPAAEPDAHALATLGAIAALATTGLGTVAMAGFGDAVARAFGQRGLMPWLLVMPLIAGLIGMFQVLNQLAVRQRRYAAIGQRNFLQACSMVGTQTFGGWLGVRPGGLVVGLGLGHAIGIASLLQGAELRSPQARAGRTRQRLWAVLSRYRRFPLVLAPSGVLNVLGMQLPALLIAYCYGSVAAGWIGMTQRVLAVPVSVVGLAVAQVYVAELSRAVRDDPARARSLFLRASRMLAGVGLAGAVAVFLTGPQLFAWVFGAGWATSGDYARLLSASLAIQLVAAPLSQTITVYERTGSQLIWDATRVGLVAGAILLSSARGWSVSTAVGLFAAASAIAYGASWVTSFMIVSRASRGGEIR